MSSAVIDYDEPLFTRDQAIAMIRADENTLDNWVRHGHVVPAGDKGRRLFSPNHLILAELIFSLANTFRVPPTVGRFIASNSIDEYRHLADIDLMDIWQGASFAEFPDAATDATTLSLVRGADGELRAWERGDREEDQVILSLPVRLIARSVFAKMKIMVETVIAKVPA